MRRKPRDSSIDHLVTAKLVSFSYLQIGCVQALSGMFTYFVVMYDYGFKMANLIDFALDDGGFLPAKGDVYSPGEANNGNSRAYIHQK